MYIDDETRETIKEYRLQIIVTMIVIGALLLSILIIKETINIVEGRIRANNRSILLKGRIVALILLFTTLFFTINSYKEYKKRPTRSNYFFLIANLLFFIGAFVRYLNLWNISQIDSESEII